MMLKIQVSWSVTSYRLVKRTLVGLLDPENEGIVILRNTGNYLSVDTLNISENLNLIFPLQNLTDSQQVILSHLVDIILAKSAVTLSHCKGLPF
jgi:hypothetical protein